MKCRFTEGGLLVTREPDDPKFRRGWGGALTAESWFLYRVLKELQKQGYTLCKVRAGRDGHLIDERVQLLRPPRALGTNLEPRSNICIYNGNYMLYDAGEAFNADGHVTLTVEPDYIKLPEPVAEPETRFVLKAPGKIVEVHV